ncbi:MAG: type I-E CRISPR-associated protein Cas6/Cse3/CasE [Arachnia sp.]
MFLTEFDINSGRRDARALLASRERLHAAVLGCFPPAQSATSDHRTLWRLDNARTRLPKLLIASPLRPDLTALNEQAGWNTGTPGRTAHYDPFLAGLDVGQRWRFRLTANPTSSVRPKDGGRGRRTAHVTAEQQLHWLVARAAQMGVAFPEDSVGAPAATVTGRDISRFAKASGGKPITLSVVQFDGLLEVTDPEALRRTLTQGVGAAKGYGCGLLTLAPSA